MTAFFFSALALAQAPPPNPPAYIPTASEREAIVGRTTALGKEISLLRTAGRGPLLDDVEVYHKAAQWLLRYPEEFYNRSYAAQAVLVLDRGLARARMLERGESPWTHRTGRNARAYRSRVDGSLQPYHVVVPPGYDKSKPARLDVVLHGRGATLSEISFLHQAEAAKPGVTYSDRLELHVFGRTNNAYRWAGETDVFEALEAVRRHYRIDPARISLRGFSMGGAGTWHIGLHFPARWMGIEAGAGFNETRRYAKQTGLTPDQEKLLHIYDVFEVALNAVNVPTVGYGGDQDPQLQASVNVQEQLKQEQVAAGSLQARFLVGPNIGHRFHPDSKRESDAFLDSFAGKPRRHDEIRFVTYTPRYGEAAWLRVESLEELYARAEVNAGRDGVTTRNVARLGVERAGPVVIDGQKFSGPGTFEKHEGRWRPARAAGLIKRAGLQGPIDDAFLDSFTVVKPSGTPFHAAPAAQASAALRRFEAEFAKWMRGDPAMSDDTAVTPARAAASNLVLEGDPQSNVYLRRILGRLPVRWDAETIAIAGRTFDARTHYLAMIYPNPASPGRYVVLNSGHTFGEREFRGTNALLYPRLGDWAVVGSDGAVTATGLFDRHWK